MIKVCIFTGSRADWGLLEPLAHSMKHHYNDFDISLMISGSHLSKQFGETSQYIPDEYSGYMTSILVDLDNNIGVTQSMGLGLIQFPGSLANINPDYLIVLGDRYEAFAAAIAAYNLGIKIAHIQGDDITKGSLDDGYRRCIRELASIHFDVSEYGSLGCVFPELVDVSYIPCDYLVMYHPNRGDDIEEVYNLRNAIKHLRNVFVILSNQDAHGKEISSILQSCYSDNFDRGWNLAHSVGRPAYLSLLKKAKCIIGNSSSGLIDAPSIGTPTVNIGSRQEGRMRASSVIDCGGGVDEIRTAIKKAMDIKFPVDNPFYKKGTIENIIKKLKETK